MTLTVSKQPNNALGVFANTKPKEKPVYLHRIVIEWLDAGGNALMIHMVRPDQYIEEGMTLLVASMPVVAGATHARASANYEVIDQLAKSARVTL
jgi:hypothetical protein